jgi:hypothetical protein
MNTRAMALPTKQERKDINFSLIFGAPSMRLPIGLLPGSRHRRMCLALARPSSKDVPGAGLLPGATVIQGCAWRWPVRNTAIAFAAAAAIPLGMALSGHGIERVRGLPTHSAWMHHVGSMKIHGDCHVINGTRAG